MPSGLSAKVQTQFSGGNTACQQVLEELGVQNPEKGRKKESEREKKGRREGGGGGIPQPKLHTLYKD